METVANKTDVEQKLSTFFPRRLTSNCAYMRIHAIKRFPQLMSPEK